MRIVLTGAVLQARLTAPAMLLPLMRGCWVAQNRLLLAGLGVGVGVCMEKGVMMVMKGVIMMMTLLLLLVLLLSITTNTTTMMPLLLLRSIITNTTTIITTDAASTLLPLL